MPAFLLPFVLSVSILLSVFLPATTRAQPTGSWINLQASFGKSSAEFTSSEWAAIIDATWGEGKSTSEKVFVFDSWWNRLRNEYGAHMNFSVNLDSLKEVYRPQIQAGVSRGRMAGIMMHFTYQFKELHNYLFDISVRNTPMNAGIPMMVIGQYGNSARFGALLAPLPDSTLLVYEAVPDHPIGLQAGDLVLGYDGIPWHEIYPTLLEAELPIFLNPVHGSTDESNYYYAMHAAGLNWHLFDTIDIVKYPSGDTLHFDTHLLAGQTRIIWGKDQIPPPGVPWPNRTGNARVGWGIIDGTNVGMITVTSWSFDAKFDIRAKFEQAIDEMMHVHRVDGLIIDLRFNTGGGALAREGLQLLFNEVVPTVGFDRRVVGSDDPQEMEIDPTRWEGNLVIQGDPDTFFNKPLAILIGPGSISAGELEARRLSFHPNARLFGLPAPGGNTGSDFITIGANDSDWFVSRTNSTQYLVGTHEYLSHVGLQPDERVWFTQEDAANGEDTVIKAALNWIETHPLSSEEEPLSSSVIVPSIYPNPFRSAATFTFELERPAPIQLEIFDVLGRHITTLLDTHLPTGQHQIGWDTSATPLAPGVYVWRLSNGEQSETGAVLLVN